MRTVRIELGEDERLDRVTFEMSAAEAVYLAKVIGNRNGNESNKTLRGGAELNGDIYDCLSGLFNRFYEDGVNDAAREIA